MNTGNIKANITKVLKNKNTFTILIIFVGIIGIYALYNWRVSEATKLVSVPYAKKEINSRTKVTTDMIAYMQVPKSLLANSKNLIQSSNGVVNKYINYGYTIPQYSMFYKEAILENAANPESEFKDLPDKYTVFNLEVDFDNTYGNSIYPGNYIDLYVKIKDKDSDKIIFGRLIKGIKVSSLYDSEGNPVFETTSDTRKPKYMFFGVPEDLYLLLMKTQKIGATIMPIPRNASYSQEERTPEIDSVYIQNYVLAKAVNFGD